MNKKRTKLLVASFSIIFLLTISANSFTQHAMANGPPGAFSLSTDADNPDTDGAFYLNWTTSVDANNYSVYSHTAVITEINSSIIWMVNETTSNYVHTSGYSDGIYYFIVVARNDHGEVQSNMVIVNVNAPGNNIPGYDMILIMVSILGSVVLIKRFKISSKK